MKADTVLLPDAIISAAGLRVIKLLVGNPPQTINDLVRVTGVTRTAVTEQLNELVTAGLVERGMERLRGRGRPRHLFSATPSALILLFASNQRLVVPAIWRAIEELGGTELGRNVLTRVSQILAEHYKAKITATEPKKRLEQFIDLLRAEGGLLELRHEGGRLAMYKRSCPFISMFDDARNVCCVDLDMISEVVGVAGAAVRLPPRRRPCCVFELENNG